MNLPTKPLMTAFVLLLCAGCAGMPGKKTAMPEQQTTRKPPPVNLAGFPAAYKDGYSDACGGAKNTKRYKADQQYKQGWQDGGFTCKKGTASSSKPRTGWAGTE